MSKSDDKEVVQSSGELISYDAYLTFATLDPERLKVISELCGSAGLNVTLTPTFLEFDYQGRDFRRAMVSFFKRLASALGEAEGEIICELWPEEGGPPVFEFFAVKAARLTRQRGRIVREPPEDVPD